jgi:hypothetical protein
MIEARDTGRGEHDVGDFVDQMTVLSRWLDRDVTIDLAGVVPVWAAFRFRDATVFESDTPDGTQVRYLVRGDAVREFVMSQVTIDEVYAGLTSEDPLPTAA